MFSKSKTKIRRKLFAPWFYQKSNKNLLRYAYELEKTQYYSIDKLKSIQWERMLCLWKHVWKYNKFYERRFVDYGLNKKSLKDPSDIKRLPILSKSDIRNNTDLLITEGYKKSNLLNYKTGGSTGKALDIYLSKECSCLRNACTLRHDRWAGWDIGEPIGAVWGNPKKPETLREKIKQKFVQPYIYLDTMKIDDQAIFEFVKLWNYVKPTLLFGHAHSIYVMAQKIEELELKINPPKGIIATSMMLLANERDYIEKIIQCKVTDRYGCEEVSLIASECEKHNGMHMNIEHLYIEIRKDNGKSAKDKESGNVIVTDLMNKAMPLIRYNVGDVASVKKIECPCGRGLPLLGRVVGRTADFLIKNDGTKVSGISLIENTLTKLNGIDQMQVIQKDMINIDLNIVIGSKFDSAERDYLVKYFKKIFPDTHIDLNEMSTIRPEKNGKYRFSICNIK